MLGIKAVIITKRKEIFTCSENSVNQFDFAWTHPLGLFSVTVFFFSFHNRKYDFNRHGYLANKYFVILFIYLSQNK